MAEANLPRGSACTAGNAQPTDQEHAVGITHFTCPDAPGFQCTVKQRYTDFLVNEVTPEGEVVRLTEIAGTNEARGRKRGRKDDQPENAEGLVGSADVAVNTETGAKVEDNGDGGAPATKKLRTDGEKNSEHTSSVKEGGTSAPTEAEETTGPSKKERAEQALAELSTEDKQAVENIFGAETTQQILNLYASVVMNPHRKPRDHPSLRSEKIPDKSQRTEAHITVRRVFASKLETATLQDEPGVLSIKAAPPKPVGGAKAKPNGNEANGSQPKGKVGWNELGGEYLHFTLYKENKDTMEVLYFIASQLKVHVKNFQFAGTKDRRGVTVQRVAVFRVHADRIAHLNRLARGWRAGNFEYKKQGLDLGELGGNQFLLTLRDCHFQGEEGLDAEQKLTLAKTALTKAAQSFGQRGYLNYYGLQRFGTFSTGTHMIGRQILSVDLEGAINSILTYTKDLLPENQDPNSERKVPQDDISRADGIRTWRITGNAREALNKIPKRFQAEAAIIQYLSKKDSKTHRPVQANDWQGALMCVQRNLRLMYVHAYQSLVWNRVVSRRWELYGAVAVEGDLVIVGEKDGEDEGATKDAVDDDGEPVFHPAADDSAPTTADAFTRARHLSREEAASGKYDVFDVVLPLPGWDMLYPANAVAEYYKEFMASEEGGGLDPHNMRRAWKDSSLSGSYRKVMARPGTLEWEVKGYRDLEEQMVETDLERLEGRREGGDAVAAKEEEGADGSGNDEVDRIAVVVKLSLGSSQYATMALRELTKGAAVHYTPGYSTR